MKPFEDYIIENDSSSKKILEFRQVEDLIESTFSGQTQKNAMTLFFKKTIHLGHSNLFKTLMDNEFTEKNLKYLFDQCEYFFKNFNRLLFRGMRQSNYGLKINTVRKDRLPRDTPVFIHNYINKIMEKKYGVDRSELLFVTHDEWTSHSYGIGCIVFPIGKFDWYISYTTRDFYQEMKRVIYNILGDFPLEKMKEPNADFGIFGKEYEVRIKSALVDLVASYEKNSKTNYDNEILIDCNKYFSVRI